MKSNKPPEMPKYCYARGQIIWVNIKDEHGDWVKRKTPYTIDQTEQARRYVNALVKGMDQKRASGQTDGLTLAAYIKRWCDDRDTRGIMSALDERPRMEKYVIPHIGKIRLDDVRPRDVTMLVRELDKLRKAGDMAPRSVLHIYRTLHNVFEGAIVDELVISNPVKVKKGELPKKIDADPEWRSRATYSVKEVERLITDSLIPVERRVMYALKALAGLRHGEAAAICWRHFDMTAEPLSRFNIVQAWSSRTSEVKSTKTEITRDVPVHPVLAKILLAWRTEHWARIYGRKPTGDDFIVPTRTMSCVAVKDAGEAMRRDLGALELRVEAGKLRNRGGHDLRSWYETRLIEDGADSLIVRRTTHAPPKDVNGGYERFSWKVLCREVGKLQITILDGDILPLGTSSVQGEVKSSNRWRKVVTPLGLEENPLDATARRGPPVSDEESLRRSARAGRVAHSSVPTLSTATSILEKAIRAGDLPRALEVVRQLRELRLEHRIARPAPHHRPKG